MLLHTLYLTLQGVKPKTKKYQALLALILLFFFLPLTRATDITTCQTISFPGHYRLTADINNWDGTCFTITTSNVTLDCDGHVVEGDGDTNGYGIYVDAADYGEISNVTIENCSVSKFERGIHFYGNTSHNLHDSIIKNVEVHHNYHVNIDLLYSDKNKVINATLYHPDLYSGYDNLLVYYSNYNFIDNVTAYTSLDNVVTNGVEIWLSDSNIVTSSNFSYNSAGISLRDSTNNTIRNNIIQENKKYDIYVQSSSSEDCNILFQSITLSGNSPFGFYNYSVNLSNQEFSELILCNADWSNLTNITIKGSDDLKNNGLFILRTDHSYFENINSSYNYDGISLSSFSSNNFFINLTTNYNSNNGIHFGGYTNKFYNIISNGNEGDGIYLDNPYYNTLSNVIAMENKRNDVDYWTGSCGQCANNLTNMTGSGGRKILFYNHSVNLSNQELAGLLLCGADWSNFTNITIRGSDNLQNNMLYISCSDHSYFEKINSSYNNIGTAIRLSNYIHIKDSVFNNNSAGILFHDYSTFSVIEGNKILFSLDYGVWERGILGIYGPTYFYNNLFNNTNNFYLYTTLENNWNTTKQYTGDNIVNGVYIAGNYWGKPDGTGFSDTCQDNNKDGICDSPYELATNNIDYLPLKKLSFVRNSYINISSSTIWHRDKGLYEPETINFKNALQQYLNNCQPDANGNCNVTLDIFSKTKGIMELYGLEILYYTKKPVKALVESFSPKDIYVTHLYIIGKDESKMCDLLNGSLTKIPRGGVAIIKGECNLLCEQIHRIILSGPCGISDSIDSWGVRDVCKQ